MSENLRVRKKVDKKSKLIKSKIQVILGCILTIMTLILMHYLGYIPLFWTLLMSLFAISVFLNLYTREKRKEKFGWKNILKRIAVSLWLGLLLLATIGVIYEMISPKYQDMAVGVVFGYFLFKLDEIMKMKN